MKKFLLLFPVVALLCGVAILNCSCSSDSGDDPNKAPTCEITSPADGASVKAWLPLIIKGNASDEDGTIAEVILTVDGEVVAGVNSVPFEYTYDGELTGDALVIELEVRDDKGATAQDKVSVTIEKRDVEDPVGDFGAWISAGRTGNIAGQDFAKVSITPKEEQQAASLIFTEVQGDIENEFGAGWDANALTIGGYTMKIYHKTFGQKPEDGRSLYISLHGGGNTTPDVNDGQWNNQKSMYTPAEGVYLAPRAAVDDWDMWFQRHTQEFYDAIIRMAVLRMDVNPDKVYLLGYSAGGDGVYRMAPRYADRWAACAMMAGHPGAVSPVNLRNIGFTLWVGANDTAYDRNIKAREFGDEMKKLKAADPKGYVHEVHIVVNKPHWMDREDAAAVPWLAEFRRNPLPDRVAWKQDTERGECVLSDFYWLSIDAGAESNDNPNKGKQIIVERDGNTFTIVSSEYDKFYIALNSNMVDFTQPVKVVRDGTTIFEGLVEPRIKDVYESAVSRKDDRYIFSAYLTVNGDSVSRR